MHFFKGSSNMNQRSLTLLGSILIGLAMLASPSWLGGSLDRIPEGEGADPLARSCDYKDKTACNYDVNGLEIDPGCAGGRPRLEWARNGTFTRTLVMGSNGRLVPAWCGMYPTELEYECGGWEAVACASVIAH